MNGLLNLTVYCLACYRLALFLSSDLGPWAVFAKLRSFLKREAKHNKPLRDSKLHLGITCIRCDSVWVAIPLALFKCFHAEIPYWISLTGDILVYGLALSAAAILLHRILPPK